MFQSTDTVPAKQCRLRKNQHARSRRGAMLIVILVLLVGFLATVAFSVDVAQMHLARTELRSATDAAAKAAAIELSRTFDVNEAIRLGTEIAAENTVNGDPLLLAGGDFSFGRSEADRNGRFVFSAGVTPNNTVRVNGRRTAGSPSGPIPLLFGNVMGFSEFEPEAIAAATYIERDVVLVIDRSGSMAGRKYLDLIGALQIFADALNQTPVEERVGLASYSNRGSQDVQLTTDLSQIANALLRLIPAGTTSISRGMSEGKAIMDRSRNADFVERTMIVMTDGLHNTGPEPRGVATQLANDRVTIHTITFGADADQRRMREIAQIGGGKHFHALSAAELRAAYREIALTLSTVITE
ncbi:vWA domain-containing protein [Stieleria varia]|nr:vWA domain-containing protein [Stieleria varia]